MIINNIRVFILFLLLIQAGFSFAQIKVLSGTSITVSTGTIISISGSSADTFEISSGAFVNNNGIITLGDSTIIKEYAGFPVKGSGFEEATRNLTQALSNENIAGLGALLTTTDSLGETTIKRGHTSYIDNSGNESVLRWFNINPSNNPTNNALTFKYDSTELNALEASDIYLFQSADSGISWKNLGGIRDSVSYSVYAAGIDSFSLFTLFPVELITGTVSTDTLCTGQNITVPYTINGQVNSGNYFRLELSDNSGSFASPLFLDSIQSVTSGTITATIPSSLPVGNGYRVRVVSTAPYITGSDNGVALFLDSLPGATGKPSGDTLVCLSSTTASNYTVSAVANAVTYNWQVDPVTAGTVSASANSASITWDASFKGIANVIASASNACGTGKADTLIVTILNVPETATAPVGDTAICITSATTSNYTANIISQADDYVWALNPANAGIISGTGNNISVSWDSLYTGNAVLSVAGQNNCGIGLADSLLIAISSVPVGSGSPIGDTAICKNATPVSDYSVPPIANTISYQWSLNPANAGIISGTGTAISVTWDSLFTGSAILSVAGSNGCGTGQSVSVFIEVKNSTDSLSYIKGDSIVCTNNSPITLYSIDSLINATSYIWLISPASAGNIAQSGNEATISWSNQFNGIADVSVTIINSCGTSSGKVLQVNVNSAPSSPSTPIGDTAICTNLVSSSGYSILSIPNASSYNWVLNPPLSGSIINNGENIIINWNAGFEGTAKLVATALNSCGESISSDSLNIAISICGSIKEPGKEVIITLFPNPAKDVLSLKLEGVEGEIKIDIIDLLGQVILMEEVAEANRLYTQVYNLTHFAKGVYFLRCETTDKIFITKFIIE